MDFLSPAQSTCGHSGSYVFQPKTRLLRPLQRGTLRGAGHYFKLQVGYSFSLAFPQETETYSNSIKLLFNNHTNPHLSPLPHNPSINQPTPYTSPPPSPTSQTFSPSLLPQSSAETLSSPPYSHSSAHRTSPRHRLRNLQRWLSPGL